VWALLEAIAGRGFTGTLLRHDDWEIDPETGSRVSFAAAAFSEPAEVPERPPRAVRAAGSAASGGPPEARPRRGERGGSGAVPAAGDASRETPRAC
jgi:hypothetical protein